VTDPLDITQTVLTRLVDLLRKLPAEQLAELYAGTATLEVVGKAGRPAKKVAAPVALPVSAEQVGGDLAKINDRAVATRYVNDLGLGVPQLRALAKELDITLASKATKAVAVREIVQWTVGRRLDSEAISRPAPSVF
jgi:hypothetical protein